MAGDELSRTETWSLIGISVACLAVLVNTLQGEGEPLIASLAFSGIAFASTFALIRWLGATFIKAGLKGKDMSKARAVEMSVGTLSVLKPKASRSRADDHLVQNLWELSAPSCTSWSSLCLSPSPSTGIS